MSKRFTLTICIIFLTTVTMRAQSGGPVSGRLVDAGTREAIIGAVIEVAPVNAPEKKKHYTTEANGTINIKSLDTGRYTFTFSYLGYKSLEKTVDIGKNATNLGTLTIEPEALTIDKVTFEVPAMRTSVKGDTVSYNAAAFKVAADADTEGLLAKMPGITVSGGTVEAQGEEVKRVLVDGREFFGEDVA